MESTKTQTAAVTANCDIHQKVTNTIIEQLESGTVPWLKPWNTGAGLALPKNPVTGNTYQGINIVLLWSAVDEKGFETHEWASFKQWSAKNESIRKGEKGTMIVYYDTMEKEDAGELKKIPFIKSSYVFNRSQLQGYQPVPLPTPQPFNERIPAIDRFIENTGAAIEHEDYESSHILVEKHGACYLSTLDKIYMPHPDAFIETMTRTRQEAYYGVLGHELIHWTGHPKRLDRAKGKKFGDQTYAAEELIAELGAAFLCAELQITATTKCDHASYIANWLKVLKDNKTFITKAASEASKAVVYLKDLQPET